MPRLCFRAGVFPEISSKRPSKVGAHQSQLLKGSRHSGILSSAHFGGAPAHFGGVQKNSAPKSALCTGKWTRGQPGSPRPRGLHQRGQAREEEGLEAGQDGDADSHLQQGRGTRHGPWKNAAQRAQGKSNFSEFKKNKQNTTKRTPPPFFFFGHCSPFFLTTLVILFNCLATFGQFVGFLYKIQLI